MLGTRAELVNVVWFDQPLPLRSWPKVLASLPGRYLWCVDQGTPGRERICADPGAAHIATTGELMRLGRVGKRAAAAVVTMIAAAVLVVPTQAPAQAAPNVAAGTAAWTPQIYPLFSGEWVQRDVSSADRNAALALCAVADGIACVAVGQGDGKHSIFHLFKCDTRSLSNFIDALAVDNNQTGGARVHFWGPNYSVYIPADGQIYTVPDHATYDFNRLDIC